MGNSSAKEKKVPTVQVTASPRTIHELITNRIKEYGSKVAQVDATSGEKLTFEAILERTAALAAGLSVRGLRPGNTALIIGENNINYPWVLLGVLQTGASAHLINPRSSPREIEHAMSISRPQMCLVSSSVSKETGVTTVLRGAASVRHVLVWGGSASSDSDLPEGISSLEEILVSPAKSASSDCISPPRNETTEPGGGHVLVEQEVKACQTTPVAPPPTPTSLAANYGNSALSAQGETSPLQRILMPAATVEGLSPYGVVSGSSVALILSSSGSTGLPKGVMLTHDNVLAALELGSLFMSSDDIVLGISPYFHAYGGVLMLMALMAGLPVIALGRFSMEAMFRAVKEHQVTVMHVVSSLLVSLSKQEKFDVSQLASLRRLWSGAAQVSALVQSALQSRLPDVKLWHSYGMTETTFTTFCGEVRADKPGSPGTLVNGMECKVVDPDTGKTVSTGARGELCFKGQMVMKGYLGNSQATDEAIDAEGWLHSGDLGFVDEDGYYFVVERLKDILKYNGYQVSPSELEALLMSHPAVSEAAVIGEPHEYGEAPRALIVLAEGTTVTAKDLNDYIEGKVAPHKQLRGGITFVSSFPRTASGKLQRKKLRALLLEDPDSSVTSSTLNGEVSSPSSPERAEAPNCTANPVSVPAVGQQEAIPAASALPEVEQESDRRPSTSTLDTNDCEEFQEQTEHRPSVSSISTNYSSSAVDSPMILSTTADSSVNDSTDSVVFATPASVRILKEAANAPLPLSEPTSPENDNHSLGSALMDLASPIDFIPEENVHPADIVCPDNSQDPVQEFEGLKLQSDVGSPSLS